MGLEITPTQVDLFRHYSQELIRWNKRINLTAISDEEGIQIRHFLDSLSILPALKPYVGDSDAPLVRQVGNQPQLQRVIDVGSGAGFPGLPLRIVCPSLHTTLLDSSAKKISFLRYLLAELGLPDVEVICARAEDLGHDPKHREQYDLAISRALGRLPALAELCLPFVQIGRAMAAMKKGDIAAELAAGQAAAVRLGGAEMRAIPIEVPFLPDLRHLVLTSKVAPTPERYPRRPGIPVKRPLTAELVWRRTSTPSVN
ncbi:MAG: 16S rRNA (guanine(527)-N(7))-methyltransferase RsmG [Chloroflexi bacterium]|nr:16S rRNA (guanine(527)-N(7))-methyltransferase RsmG [Chloroflexota bacterium]